MGHQVASPTYAWPHHYLLQTTHVPILHIGWRDAVHFATASFTSGTGYDCYLIQNQCRIFQKTAIGTLVTAWQLNNCCSQVAQKLPILAVLLNCSGIINALPIDERKFALGNSEGYSTRKCDQHLQ